MGAPEGADTGHKMRYAAPRGAARGAAAGAANCYLDNIEITEAKR